MPRSSAFRLRREHVDTHRSLACRRMPSGEQDTRGLRRGTALGLSQPLCITPQHRMGGTSRVELVGLPPASPLRSPHISRRAHGALHGGVTAPALRHRGSQGQRTKRTTRERQAHGRARQPALGAPVQRRSRGSTRVLWLPPRPELSRLAPWDTGGATPDPLAVALTTRYRRGTTRGWLTRASTSVSACVRTAWMRPWASGWRSNGREDLVRRPHRAYVLWRV